MSKVGCGKSMSQPLLWVFFLFSQSVGVAQLVSGFLSEGIVPSYSYRLGLFVGGHHLGPELLILMVLNDSVCK